MKRYSLRCKSIIYFTILIMMVSASCSPIFPAQSTPTVVPTSTPEKMELINGELDACLLVSPTEVESVLGIRVVRELRFAMVGAIDCKYISVSDEHLVFLTSVTTDATLKKGNAFASSAIEAYEMHKTANLKLSEVLKIEEIGNFGDQAFLVEGVLLEINVLNNDIYYNFNTRTAGGIGYDALMELARIALQRMP
jgi:hypothetical protein